MTERKLDTDAILWSGSLASDQPLLVLLHGRGSNEADLFDLGPFLPSQLTIASVRGPIAEGPGFSWYHADTADLGTLDADIDSSVRAVLDWVDSLAAVPPVGLLGFSQGAAMALQLMRYRPYAFSFVIQLSGFVFDGPEPGDAELTDRHMPVFWGRGNRDSVISADRVEQTAVWLPMHARVDERLYETGHSVTRQELADISEFIGRQTCP